MNGEDLSVLFEGREPPERRWFTSCYDDHLLAGDRDWFLLADSEGRRKRLYDRRSDPKELHDVAAEQPADRRPALEGARGRGRRHAAAVRLVGGGKAVIGG